MPSARLSVTSGGAINASTYEFGSFFLENISTDGAQLSTVTIDLTGSVFAGMIFDPLGQAGDEVAKPFTVDSLNGSFTLVSSALSNGSALNGYKTLTLQLQGFDPGESLAFSIDADPASIKGTSSPGPGESGSVAGVEFTGSLITFGFAGGQSLSNEIFKQASSAAGGVATAQAGLPIAPTINVVGVSGSTGTVASAQQTVAVTGPAGATVRVVVMEGGAFTEGAASGAPTLGPFEANSILGSTSYEVTLNGQGQGQVAVNLAHSAPQGGHNIITAAVVNPGGVTGPVSAPVALNFGTGAAAGVTVTPSGGSTSVTEGGATDTLSVVLNTQPSSNVTVSVAGNADVTGAPGALTFTPANWATPQIVTVSGLNDTAVEGTEVHNLTFTTSSTQAAYNGLIVAPSPVTVIDNPAAQPVAFTQSTLTGLPDGEYTSLQFGADGRLYLSKVDGTILAVQVQASSGGGYQVAPGGIETINTVKQIDNFNDDGTLASAGYQGLRQVTGILVTQGAAPPGGTAPVVMYVSSSDPRIGAGPSGGDVGLDTNSGVVSKLTQLPGGGWSRVDLVRGLPRSEENHSVNGMQLSPDGQTMYLAVGGNTNMGAPSNNFAYTPEYAYSAAILKIDLAAVEAMSTKTDTNGNPYKYNLPTLQAGPNDPFPTDPFGGRDGLSQAVIVSGGPVQIYSPGYRNPYDLVLTQSGQLYTIDNGANAGWGGVPILNGQGQATNAPNNGGVDIQDALFHVTQGFYGGFPNPIRANPTGAGHYPDGSTTPTNQLPPGWPPVPTANPIEANYLAPSTNGALYSSFGASTNGLTEFTASTFGNAMKGDLLTVSWDDKLYRIDLSADGLTALSVTSLTGTGTVLGGGLPLDVTTRGEGQSFAGSIWVANYGGPVTIFTPGAGPTEPPPGDGDADGDGLIDKVDRFAEDATNGKGTDLAAGQTLTWNFSQNIDPPGPNALFNMGFTGLMANGVDSYTALYDAANIKAGGAAAGFQIEQVPAGDALVANSQQNGFQFGVDINAGVTSFVIETKIDNPFGGTPSTTPVNYKSQGFFIGTGEQDNYLKIVAAANGGAGGIEVASENAGTFSSQMYGANIVGAGIQALDSITLRLAVNVTTGSATPTWTYTVGGQAFEGSGAPVQLSGATLQAMQGSYTVAGTPSALAVGVISTSYQSNQPFTAFWESIKITANGAPPAQQLALTTPSVTLAEGNSGLTAFTYTVARTGGSTGTASVNWSVAGSGANPASGADFQGGALPSGVLTFAAGETSKTITVNVAGDTVSESSEGFTLTLSGATGATLGTATAAGTITNDDGGSPSGQVFTSPGPGSTLTGGAGNDTFNASMGNDVLTGGAGGDVFRLPAEPWAPITITDFTIGADQLDLSALFQASGYAGSNPVADGYVYLQSNGSGGTIVRYDRDASGGNPVWPNTIVNLGGVSPNGLTWAQLSGGGGPPPTPTVALTTTSLSLAEGASGTTAFNYTVTRTGGSTGTASVNWSVSGSGANPANAADFQGGVLPSGVVNFAAGETSKTITVNVAGDATIEQNEGFTLTLSAPTGATLGTATATGTITNDDGAPPAQQLALTTPSVTLAEGNSGLTAFTYTVARTGGSTGTASVNWSVAGSGANPASGADFQGGALPSGVLTFAAGETGKTITVNVAGDTVSESSEGFTLTLSGATGATLGTATAAGTITNDDGGSPSGQVFTSPGPGSTLTGGAGNDTFNASMGNDVLTGGAGGDVFRLPAEPWAPITITDFTIGADQLDLSALFQASGYAGSNPVADGYVYLQSNGSGGTIVRYDRDASGGNPVWPNTIVNLGGVSPNGLTWAQLSGGGGPPPTPTVALTTTSLSLGEGASGTTAFNYTVTRTGGSTGTASVNWSVSGSGANPANAADFQGGVLPSGVVNFAAGETSKTITVNVAGDATIEQNEGFTLTLSAPTGATLGTATATGTITNDDGAPPGGQVFNSPGPGSSLTGGAGADTFNASQGLDTLTGGAGADVFRFPAEPWAPITITDFTPGQDKLDLSPLFDASGYNGTNPVGDGYVYIESNGSGGSVLRFDRDAGGPDPVWPNTIINLNIAPAQVNASDWIM